MKKQARHRNDFGCKSRRWGACSVAGLVFLIGTWLSAFALGSKAGEEDRPQSTLVVLPFEQRGGDPKLVHLGLRMSEMLATALRSRPTLDVISGTAIVDPEEARQWFDKWGAQYVLSGSYLSYKGSIRLACALQRPDGDLLRKIPPVQMKTDQILLGMHQLSREVLDALDEEQEVRGNVPRIALGCFENASKRGSRLKFWASSPKQRAEWIGPDLASSLSTLLRRLQGLEVVNWEAEPGHCGLQDIDQAEMARELKADAILSGQYKLQGSKLRLYPTFYVAKQDEVVHLPVAKSSLDDYLNAKLQLAKHFGNFVDGALDEEGNWKIEAGLGKLGPEGYISRAGQLTEQGDYQLAHYYLVQALAERPNDPEARYQLGRLLIEQERFSQAALELSKAIAQEGDFAEAHVALGEAYYRLGKYQNSVEAYERALDLDSELEGIRVTVGNLYVLLDDQDKARESFRQALEEDPSNPDASYWLGVLSSEQGRLDEAAAMFEQTINLDANYEEARLGLAYLYVEGGKKDFAKQRYREAINSFDRSIQTIPTLEGHLWRARSYRQMDPGSSNLNYTQAIMDYRSALGLEDKFGWGTFKREWTLLDLTELYILTSSYQEARQWAADTLSEVRAKSAREEIVARFLLVTALVLLNDEPYQEELWLLREQLKARREQRTGAVFVFRFEGITDYVTSEAGLDNKKRSLLLNIIEETKQAL